MTENKSSAIGKANILVVDDEEIVHASLKRILSKVGHHVQAVFSAREGLDLLDNQPFDLVIVDLMMPEMNGIQFLETLATRALGQSVIMVTGYPTISTAVKALRLGALDYVAKPFTRKELLSPVQRALCQDREDGDRVLLPVNEENKIRKEDLSPGVEVVLPRHAWAQYQQDGTFLIGIEKSFLRICKKAASLILPGEMDLIEQGYVGIYLQNENEEEHGVAMPLGGQVIAVNHEIVRDLSRLSSDSWLIRIIPSHLEEELGRLAQRS